MPHPTKSIPSYATLNWCMVHFASRICHASRPRLVTFTCNPRAVLHNTLPPFLNSEQLSSLPFANTHLHLYHTAVGQTLCFHHTILHYYSFLFFLIIQYHPSVTYNTRPLFQHQTKLFTIYRHSILFCSKITITIFCPTFVPHPNPAAAPPHSFSFLYSATASQFIQHLASTAPF